MANSPEELEQLKAQVQSLTARVYELEQRVSPTPRTQPQTEAQTAPPPAGSAPASPRSTDPMRSAQAWPAPRIPSPIPPSSPPPRSGNLEEKIGKYWLNRIGVFAILIGVAYFLKFAFDNDWIGPA